jgi:hypothetical protein
MPKNPDKNDIPLNKKPLNQYPLGTPNLRQITFAFTLYYKSDHIWVNCIIVYL